MNDVKLSGIIQSIRSSYLVRMLLIGFLIVLLQMPIAKIRALIGERQHTRDGAVEEVRAKWGSDQSIIGPRVVVPYVRRWIEIDREGNTQPCSATEYATFLPETLKITGEVQTELLYRGIFEIPVYRMSLEVGGRFSRPDFAEWAIEPDDVLWERAYLSVLISDARAITKQSVLSWNGALLEFLPSAGEFGQGRRGIHAKLRGFLNGETFYFSFPLDLNGSLGVRFAPFGRETEVQLTSNWSAPSFQGAWLPTRREVRTAGFDAVWNIPFLGRNYPQCWLSSSSVEEAVSHSLFGVNLATPVDHYRMSHRSVKYQLLFLALTFAVLWLFEIRTKKRIHSIQYLLIGAGMCLFYLLELSLAEHLGFIAAYALASAAVVALIASYSVAVLKSVKRAGIVGVALALLYIYLYVLLMIEDYALLIGSLGLFFMLAGIMFLTRSVAWYTVRGNGVSESWEEPAKEKEDGI